MLFFMRLQTLKSISVYISKKNMKVFMTIDFESVNQNGKWFAYAIMIASYPSGEILDTKESICHRSVEDYDDVTRDFWEKHPEAYEQLMWKSSNNTPEQQEIELCKYVSNILLKYPHIYIISDNPQYDIRLLDNILERHSFSPVALRSNNLYLQCICTWSFKMGVISILGKPHKHFFTKKPNISKNRRVDDYFGPKHMPIADCAYILSQHFGVMDIVNSIQHNRL